MRIIKRWIAAGLMLIASAGGAWSADWDTPSVTTNYVTYTSGLKDRDVDAARMFDPAYTSATNVPQYTIRWNGSQNRLERWDGSAWGPLVLGITGGGCGANSASACRTALGLAIGTNVQAYDADLTALAGLNSTGFTARTASNTWAQRTLTTSGDGLSVTNGNGVSGNPTFSLSSTLQALSTNSVPSPPLKIGPNTTPVSWGSQIDVIQVGQVGAFAANRDNVITYMTSNMYWDGSDWVMMSDGSAGKLTITNNGLLRYEAASGKTEGTAADETNVFQVAANGKITSNAPCASGYTRIAPGVCRLADVEYTSKDVPLTRDACTAITLPSGATGLLIDIYMAARSANSVGQRATAVHQYGNSGCTGSVYYSHFSNAYEHTAVTAETTLSSNNGLLLVTSSTRWIKFVDDEGNRGLARYVPVMYWDN